MNRYWCDFGHSCLAIITLNDPKPKSATPWLSRNSPKMHHVCWLYLMVLMVLVVNCENRLPCPFTMFATKFSMRPHIERQTFCPQVYNYYTFSYSCCYYYFIRPIHYIFREISNMLFHFFMLMLKKMDIHSFENRFIDHTRTWCKNLWNARYETNSIRN